MRLLGLRRLLNRGQPAHGFGADDAMAQLGGASAGPCAKSSSAAWSPARAALLDRLWGEGHAMPGGDAEFLRLALPLGLSAASSVLLAGAELGGPARALATEFGASATALEHEAGLVALPPRFFDAAIALDTIRDRRADTVLAALTGSLKPRGQLVLLQLIADAPLEPDEAVIAAWCACERRPPALPTSTHVTRVLARLGFDVRLVEDVSARHIRAALRGWQNIVAELKAARPESAEAAALVAEAELWTRRISLIHSGRIRLMRWHAIGHGDAAGEAVAT
ncbi:MAG TPA: hypothetical protein VHS58_16935 [Acetobacteraceae bacterium]|jgi:hypothetical protein|nr:hypothetical protein [Acetobacteraceae bacterium]